MNLNAQKKVQVSLQGSQLGKNHQQSIISPNPHKEKYLYSQVPSQKNCSETQSTDEQLSSLQADPCILSINCYQKSYSINLNSMKSIRTFMYKLGQCVSITNITKKSLMLIVVQRAKQVNQNVGELWQRLKTDYENAQFFTIFNS